MNKAFGAVWILAVAAFELPLLAAAQGNNAPVQAQPQVAPAQSADVISAAKENRRKQRAERFKKRGQAMKEKEKERAQKKAKSAAPAPQGSARQTQ